jgi:F-type H+-transporting ATPase subunit delta
LSESASISSGIASRYATAVFSLAKEEKKLVPLEADVDALEIALNGSADLRALVTSPLYSRKEMGMAISAVAKKMKLQATMVSTLALMADKRRLFILPSLLTALRARIADDRAEVTAEVTSAKALTKTQAVSLAKTLKAQLGLDVKIKATVDDSLIGGLVVKVGSKMIDTSIRSKLNALQNIMKEVG